MKDFIKEFLNERPEVVAAFGYGSGVFKQLGYDSKEKPQIDLILIVNDMKLWHKENIKKNPKDYSFIGRNFFLNSSIDEIKGITGITYQSNIEYKGHLFKYGIIEYGDFVRHMQTWDSFYVPGRFQKPILTIKSNNFIDELILQNRRNACKVGLLCLNNKDLKDLYLTICNLSYSGDTRMKVAENPKKVENIVGASYDKFNEMYNFNDLYQKNGERIEYEIDIDELPSSLEKYIKDDKTKEKVMEYLSDLNRKESSLQTMKGIKTNGIVKSLRYGLAKVLKKFR
ncbi:mitochondrial translocator assembly and maintenance protein 41 homolog [Firmicutes bacterium CAG:884]|nr:mitochondrial translocator assembly and maintenance protein 41 homolog [Firmicutes bacterium CAG:884]